jgi:hypothetical protein
MNTDYSPVFRFHKQFLQLLHAENPGRWTLKNPLAPAFKEYCDRYKIPQN